VGQAEAAVGAKEDDAAVSTEAVVEVGDGFSGGDLRGGAVGDPVSGPLAQNQLHDGLAPSREGDRGGEIVGIAAAPDEGGVADTARGLVEGSAGGSGGGEVAVEVDGDGADGVVTPLGGVVDGFGGHGRFGALVVVEDVAGEGFVGEAGGFAGLGVAEAFALAVEDQLGVVNEDHAVGVGKLLGAGADEVDVGAFFQDEAGGLDGVAKAFNAGHAAGLHAASVHEEGVKLDSAVRGEEAAAAGIEGGIVFKDGDGGFDGVEGGTA